MEFPKLSPQVTAQRVEYLRTVLAGKPLEQEPWHTLMIECKVRAAGLETALQDLAAVCKELDEDGSEEWPPEDLIARSHAVAALLEPSEAQLVQLQKEAAQEEDDEGVWLTYAPNYVVVVFGDGDRGWDWRNVDHRQNGPASEGRHGTWWYRAGELHREEGPAVEHPDGSKEYWRHNVRVG